VDDITFLLSFSSSHHHLDTMLQATRRGALRSAPPLSLHWAQQASSFASTSRQSSSEPPKQIAEAVKEAAQTTREDPPTKEATTPRDAANLLSPRKSAKSKTIGPLNFDFESFPSLLHKPHPVLDSYDRHSRPATAENPYASSVTIYNDSKTFSPTKPSAASLILSGGDSEGNEIDSATYLSTVTPLSVGEINDLHQYILGIKRVTQMTGKGKLSRMSSLVVTGNGRGLVGYGEGKDDNAGTASKKAFHQAVKRMDYVERYDDRTIPAEMKGKWGGTTVTLRPRPAGFGLRVPPSIHVIARSCGITDLSASILGSTTSSKQPYKSFGEDRRHSRWAMEWEDR
jgi:small subunit ribosomal protein S5